MGFSILMIVKFGVEKKMRALIILDPIMLAL